LRAPGTRHWESAEICWTAAELLGQIGPAASDATPTLIAALHDDDPHVRAVAAANLPAIDAPAHQAVPELLAMAKREPTVVVLRALSEYGEAAQDAISALVDILEDRQLPTEVRWNAARTLGKIRAPAVVAVGALVDHLQDEAATIREHSAEALGDIGPPAADAVAALVSVLDDPATRVRRDAARSLGQIGPAAAGSVPPLKKLLKDPEQIVRDAARVALQTLAPDEPLPEVDDEAVSQTPPSADAARTDRAKNGDE
jgi:HEAT repeat protein